MSSIPSMLSCKVALQNAYCNPGKVEQELANLPQLSEVNLALLQGKLNEVFGSAIKDQAGRELTFKLVPEARERVQSFCIYHKELIAQKNPLSEWTFPIAATVAVAVAHFFGFLFVVPAALASAVAVNYIYLTSQKQKIYQSECAFSQERKAAITSLDNYSNLFNHKGAMEKLEAAIDAVLKGSPAESTLHKSYVAALAELRRCKDYCSVDIQLPN